MDAVAASAVGAEVACKRATPLLPHLLRRLFAELPGRSRRCPSWPAVDRRPPLSARDLAIDRLGERC